MVTSEQSTKKVVLAGECMVTRPFSMGKEPEFLAVVEALRSSDLTYGHVETNFGEFSEVEAPARSDSRGSYFLTDPRAAKDLRWAGVEIGSLAQNHTFDFGKPGVLSTIKHMEAAGIAHAGTGRDLEEAREPAYLETEWGRVAVISASTGNGPHEWATLPKATLPGRAGVNPLRVDMRTIVPEDVANQLKEIWQKIGIQRGRGIGGFQEPGGPENFSLGVPGGWGAHPFQVGDHFEIEATLNAHDLAGNLRSVEEAVTMSDLVIVAYHFSASEGTRGDTPPTFATKFAHACIDAGADIFIGHGWHKTLGIEIYKGKPIIYGIGNFFAQSEFVRRVPFDGYESWGHDIDLLTTLTPAAYPLHPGYMALSETWWSSAILELDMSADGVEEIRLLPVEMGREVGGEGRLRRGVGRGEHAFTDGRPFMASGGDAKHVLERYQSLSKEMGTNVSIEGDVGVIRLGGSAETRELVGAEAADRS